MKKEVHKLCDQTLHIYLFYLVGITLFTDKRATYVDVAYLRYSRDLEVATGYSWGVATLSHLYKEINNVAHWNTKHLSGYLTLLQV